MINGIAVDETGRVYVVDQLFNKVEVIRRLSDSEGKKMLPEPDPEPEPEPEPKPPGIKPFLPR